MVVAAGKTSSISVEEEELLAHWTGLASVKLLEKR
jgi:hypothetical protein